MAWSGRKITQGSRRTMPHKECSGRRDFFGKEGQFILGHLKLKVLRRNEGCHLGYPSELGQENRSKATFQYFFDGVLVGKRLNLVFQFLGNFWEDAFLGKKKVNLFFT